MDEPTHASPTARPDVAGSAHASQSPGPLRRVQNLCDLSRPGRIAAALGAAALLALSGTAAGAPAADPARHTPAGQATDRPAAPAERDAVALRPPAVPTADPAAPLAVRTSELTVPTGDGLGLPATLRVPVGAESAPAMVLVHGAGPGPRAQYAAEAEAFALAGVATLTYDKRTVGYSLTERSYSQLADDAVAALDLLRRQPGIDPATVGLWGLSEGGWVAPLAASRDPGTAFLVVVGANGLTPLRQQTWSEAVKVQAAGVEGSLVDAASTGVYRLLADLDMFPEAYYDPVPTLRGLTLPVLGVWGALDRSTPPVESVAVVRDALDRAGNRHYTLRTVAGADHGVRTSTDGFGQGLDFAPEYVPLIGSWVAAVAAGDPPATSISGIGEQIRPTAEVAPAAWYESGPAHGIALLVMLVGFVGFGLVAAGRTIGRWIAGGPTTGAGSRARTRSITIDPTTGTRPATTDTAPRADAAGRSPLGTALADPPDGADTTTDRSPGAATVPGTLRIAARTVAMAGSAAVVGTLAYLVTLTLVRGGYSVDPGPLLAGRPLPWLALQATAVVTVVAGVLLGSGLARRRPALPTGEQVRIALLLAAAAVFVPWALYWGLLLP